MTEPIRQIEQFIEIRQKMHDNRAAWYRQMLTLASGGLAILAGFGPAVPQGMGRYFLVGTWVFLGVGICAGAAATYLEVNRAKNLAEQFRLQLQQSLQSGTGLSPNVPIVARPHRFFSWSEPVMVSSLLLAVVCLVSYSVLVTLSAE